MKVHKSPPSRIIPLSFALGAVAGTAFGCTKGTAPAQVTSTAASVSAPVAPKGAPLPDADIAHAIERHFQDERLLRSQHLQVAVAGGIASLSGSVADLRAKERAVAVAETIRGVRSVVDLVSVTPIARTDDQLKRDVTAALHRDIATSTHAIGVAVKDGTVTLSGKADSWEERHLFEDVAASVPGVKAITNNVDLHYSTARSESEILADVKHRIANDAWLDANVLTVTAKGQTVDLSGIVRSAAEKSRARSDGWVAGVAAVNVDGIIVDWSAHGDQKAIVDFPTRSDAQIAQAVRDAFRLDPRLKTLVPQVTIHSGSVVLSGTVDSASARLSAERDARDTWGVWGVEDDVLVQPSGTLTDADIERAAKRALKEDALLSDSPSIHVSTAKGKVTLNGTLPSRLERLDAISDVEMVPGVTEIDDALLVKRPPEEIKAAIEDRVFWDAMVPRDRVSVAVAPDGVATLTGTVDDWSGIRAAEDDGLRGGATRVINLLKLENHPEVVAPPGGSGDGR